MSREFTQSLEGPGRLQFFLNVERNLEFDSLLRSYFLKFRFIDTFCQFHLLKKVHRSALAKELKGYLNAVLL